MVSIKRADFVQQMSEHSGINDSAINKKILDRALFNGGIKEWITADLQKVTEAVKSTLLFHDKGACRKSRAIVEDVESVVEYLFLKRDMPNRTLASKKILKAIFLEKDPEMLKAFCSALQKVLDEGFQNFQNGNVREEIFNIFVQNAVAFLPFSYPEEGETFCIPAKVNGEWKRVEYRVEKRIELTEDKNSPRLPKLLTEAITARLPSLLSRAITYMITTFVRDLFSSHMPAFKLVNDEGALPYLVFLGTTYPGGDGFLATILSDLTPGFSPGGIAIRLGEENLRKALSEGEKVRLVGLSLGGALTLKAADLFKESVLDAYAFNPPGSYDWENYTTDLPIHIFWQWNDMVARGGYFPEGENVTLTHVLRERSEDPLNAHQRVYTANPEVTLLRGSTTLENHSWKRRGDTYFRLFGSPILFFPILGTYMGLRKPKRVYEHLSFKHLESQERTLMDVAAIATQLFVALLFVGSAAYLPFLPHMPLYITLPISVVALALGTILGGCAIRGALRQRRVAYGGAPSSLA